MHPRLILYPAATADAPSNMAIDEWLALEAGRTGHWHLRLYGWSEPAFTFGYSQPMATVWAEVQSAMPTDAPLPSVVRRITGGGIVDHRADLTYALALPGSSPRHRAGASSVYTDLHRWIRTALAAQGIDSALAPCDRGCAAVGRPAAEPARVNTLCFAQPEPSDLIDAAMRKIAGAAMKRTASFLLIQGSLNRARLGPAFDEEAFAGDFAAAVAAAIASAPATITRSELPAGEELAALRARYAGRPWNERR